MVSISNIIIFRKEVVCRTDIAFLYIGEKV